MKKSTLTLIASVLMSPLAALAAGNDWMTPLNGSLPLSQFSIPGTHDSGARVEPFPGTAKCQNLTISEQLNAGVRFLDIRCRHIDNAFTIHHGAVYQNINFADVLNSTIGFLNANPGETVIMSVKEEHTASNTTRSFEATFDTYVAQTPSKWLLASGTPTLDAARGKIVLFRRFGASSLPKGIDASNFTDNTTFSTAGRLRVQDRYNVSNNDNKWNSILAILNEARYGGPNTLYVNFASGVTSIFGVPNIPTVSNNINPRLTSFFAANTSGRFGAILMDFADAAKAKMIYDTNAPVGRPVHHPAYFMIVNRNSGKAFDLSGGNTANGGQVNQWTYTYSNANQRWALAPTENSDHFRITSWVSGKSASIENDSTATGAKLHAWDYTGNNPGQQFDLIDAGNGYYKIRNVKSNLVLEIVNSGTANNDRIQQNSDNGSTNQHWRLQPWGDYFIRANTGKYICVSNSGSANGSAIVQNSWQNNFSFGWKLEGVTNGHVKVSSLNAPTRAISILNASTVSGADTKLQDYNVSNPGDQKLVIIPRTDGRFKFRYVHSSMTWDIPGGTTANQTPLRQYNDNANSWKEFHLERMTAPANPVAMILLELLLEVENGMAKLSWPSQSGYFYQPFRSVNLSSWTKLVPSPLAGNGELLGVAESLVPDNVFYRLAVMDE